MGLAAAAVAGSMPPYGHSLTVRCLVAWCAGAGTCLVLIYRVIRNADANATRRRCSQEDPGRGAIDAILLVASAASLAAVFYALRETGQAKTFQTYAVTAIALTAAVLSWLLTHTIYAVHYARLYYHDDNGEPMGGLDFHCDEPPDYLDFVYYAFCVACTFGTTDVELNNHHMRRTTTKHTLLSFAYGTVTLALVVNVVASLLSGN